MLGPTCTAAKNRFFILGLGIFMMAATEAGTRSKLSRWLSDTSLVELGTLFTDHPRFAGGSLQVLSAGTTALDDAIVTVISNGIRKTEDITLVKAAELQLRPLPVPQSVDDLQCARAPVADHQLYVSVRQENGQPAEVQLNLVDTLEPDVIIRTWQWQGRLSKHEDQFFNRAAYVSNEDGSYGSPWRAVNVEQVSAKLSAGLVCALRPQIRDQLDLSWVDDLVHLPPVFNDTTLHTRQALGALNELNLVTGEGDYSVRMGFHPMANGIWQVRLEGIPTRTELPVVQSVTHVRAAGLSAADNPLVHTRKDLQVPGHGEPASKYLGVELLQATQSDSRFARAELQLHLRLVNQASRPMEYALSVSGGHYQHCIADPKFYRHDRFGYLQGTLAPGESTTRVMRIAGARHSPTPWFGMRRCAGFNNLNALENFSEEGAGVTQFVRWTL